MKGFFAIVHTTITIPSAYQKINVKEKINTKHFSPCTSIRSYALKLVKEHPFKCHGCHNDNPEIGRRPFLVSLMTGMKYQFFMNA